MTEKEKAKAYDKKIREAILNGLIDCRDAPDLGWSNFGGIHIDDCIDWLEKQGEQASSQTNERAWLYLISDVLTWKDGIGQYLDDPRVQELAKRLCSEYAQKLYNSSILSNSSNTEKNEQKPADKIEPRFKVGDWVVNKFGDSWHIDSLDNKNYQVSDGKGNYNYFPISKQNEMHLWTIQDAKDGDVLSFYSEYKGNKMVQIGIIEKYVSKYGGCSNTFKMYVGVNWDNNLQIGKYMGCSNIHPATKEQRDILMKAMNDAGYKWNAGTKTLEKLEKSSFHEGDWVVYNNDICQIVKREEGCNKLVTVFGIEKELVNERNLSTTRLWTIQDANDGDIIHFGTVTAIFKKYIGREKCICYCSFCKDGGFEIPIENGEDNVYGCYNATPATKEQRDILMKAMNDAGYKWNAGTKTLAKLVEPKFKVGDKIVNLPMKYMGGSWTQGTISKITDDKYIFTDGSYIYISNQDSWKLVHDKKSKFDPKTLQPFDKVLVRRGNENYNVWFTDFVSDPPNSDNEKTLCMCVGDDIAMVIPYNDDTKHLISTTDEAPEYYRYWED